MLKDVTCVHLLKNVFKTYYGWEPSSWISLCFGLACVARHLKPLLGEDGGFYRMDFIAAPVCSCILMSSPPKSGYLNT